MAEINFEQADVDAILDRLVSDVSSGVEEIRIRDRMVRKMNPLQRYELLKKIKSDVESATDGGIMKWSEKATS